MTKLALDSSTSLDGFVRAADPTPEAPPGAGGERLHEWAFGDDEDDRRVLSEAGRATGAIICGRRTYDDSLRFWGPDGPTGPRRLPVFVVTTRTPETSPDEGVYDFVTHGIEAALHKARAVAGERTVSLMSGADVARQYLDAGLVDEVSLHVVPVLFGDGLRLFDRLDRHVDLEPLDAIRTAAATHLRYRVAR